MQGQATSSSGGGGKHSLGRDRVPLRAGIVVRLLHDVLKQLPDVVVVCTTRHGMTRQDPRRPQHCRGERAPAHKMRERNAEQWRRDVACCTERELLTERWEATEHDIKDDTHRPHVALGVVANVLEQHRVCVR